LKKESLFSGIDLIVPQRIPNDARVHRNRAHSMRYEAWTWC